MTESTSFVCEARGCERLADWAFIGEGGDMYLCEFHGGAGHVAGWTRIEHDDAAAAATSFTCPSCHRTSHNPNDVAYSFCGACRRFWRQLNPGIWDDGQGTLHVDIDANLAGNGYEINEQTRRMLTETWLKLVDQGMQIEIVE